jgi:hypothetical protein
MPQTKSVLVAALFCLCLLSGCSRQDGATAKVVPVAGQVTFKNQGVTAAEIYFLPDAEKGNTGVMGSAILQEDGSFRLSTYPKGDGVAPGAYKVTLGLGRRQEKELQKYRKVETTPLKIEVPEEGFDNLVVDLDKGKIEAR